MWFLKSKVQKVWLRSLLILIGILMLAVTAFAAWMIYAFTDEITDLHYNLTTVMQRSIDMRLNEIESISSQVELSAVNRSLSKLKSTYELSETSAFHLANQIHNYKLANSFIKSIYVYYPAIDYVVGNLGSFPAKSYFLLGNNLSYDGCEKWLSSLASCSEKGFYFENNSFKYTKQLPYNDFAESTAIITIELDKLEIERILYGGSKGAIACILSNDNNVYAMAGDDANSVLSKLPSEAYADQNISKWKNYFILRQSSYTGILQYITIVTRTQLLAAVYQIRNIAYVFLTICLVIGVFLSIFVSLRNNRPMQSLIAKIKKGNESNDSVDEYQLLNKMLNRSDQSELLLEKQHLHIESLFLSNLLSAEQSSSQSIFAEMQRLDLEFAYPQFAIILLRHTNMNLRSKSDAFADIVPSIHTAITEFSFISAEYLGDLVLLFNLDNKVIDKQIEQIALEIARILPEHSNYITAVGGLYETLPDIIKSYQQALKVAELNSNTEGGVFIYDALALKNVYGETFSTNLMSEFSSAMDGQHYSTAQKVVTALFNQYIVQDANAYISRCKKYAVVNKVIENVKIVSKQNKTLPCEDCITALSQAKTLMELRDTVYDILSLLNEKYEKSSAHQTANVAARAMKKINSDYTNPMIGLYSISEQLGISNSYLSTIFKETYGQGVAQCINELRVTKAKELLTTTDLSVKEVAVRVGFTSDISFIRVFKQYASVTPGKFTEKDAFTALQDIHK